MLARYQSTQHFNFSLLETQVRKHQEKENSTPIKEKERPKLKKGQPSR
jgi:hypothetical protein